MSESEDDQKPKEYGRVLVLAGGGAKGAYAFGCLQAFKELKIKFDAVAGTSVGALNALIWATEGFEKGLDLWRSLSFTNVYPPKFPRWLPDFAKWTVASVFVLLQMLWATLHQIPVPGAPFFRVVISIFGLGFPLVVPMAVTTKVAPHLLSDGGISSTPTAWAMFLLVGILIVGAGVHALGRKKSQGGFLFSTILLGTAWSAPGLILVEIVAPEFVGSHPILGIFVVFAVMGGLLGVPYLLASRFMQKTVMSSTPLETTIQEIVRATTCKIPCFVTTGCLQEVFDPDRGGWYTRDLDHDGVAKSWAEWEPNLERDWIPKYHGIHKLSPDKGAKLCLASAALPLGIVEDVLIEGESHVDGGIVDNAPLYPFLELVPASEVFLVLLEPFQNDEEAQEHVQQLLENWRELDRKIRVAKHPVPSSRSGPVSNFPYREKNNPPTVIPYRHLSHIPKIEVFYPVKSLGSFLTGTMNFNNEYAERIRSRGYEDARGKLTSSPRSSTQ